MVWFDLYTFIIVDEIVYINNGVNLKSYCVDFLIHDGSETIFNKEQGVQQITFQTLNYEYDIQP